jgi:tetratricopeptide (TPR) repeat protein
MKSGKVLIIILVLFISKKAIFAQEDYTSLYETMYKQKLEEYEKNVNILMDIDKIPGLSVAFVKGDFVWSKGFGKIDVENEVEITSEALFQNSTLLKFMVAISILQLHENGKINIDSEIRDYLPDLDEKHNSFTIRNNLDFLGSMIFSEFEKLDIYMPLKSTNVKSSLTPEELDIYIFQLIKLIENISGKRIEDYLKDNIWNPLLMFRTRIENKREIIKDRVKSYIINKGKVNNYLCDQNYDKLNTLKIRTTVNDMVKLVYGIFSNRLFKNSSFEMLFTPFKSNQESDRINGLNWDYQPVNGRFAVNFLNDSTDNNTQLIYFPKDTLAIAIACNLKNTELLPYIKRLYHLVLDEPVELHPYFDDPKYNWLFFYMNEVFNYGLSAYNLYGNNIVDENIDFGFFNNLINTNENNENISQMYMNNTNKESFLKLGLFIASKLDENNGKATMEKYHSKGALEFFNDYIQLYKNAKEWPSQLKFNTSFEETMDSWVKDWNLTLNNYTSSLYFYPGENLQIAYDKLKKLYDGKKVYPNFCDELSYAIRQYALLNKFKETQGIGLFGMELFSKCACIYHALGLAFAWFYDADVTYDLFRKAQAYTSPYYSRVDHFIKEAKSFRKWGKVKEALAMLDRAVKLDKKEAKLYSFMGDLYLDSNQKTRAKRYYNKALNIDPEFKHAKMQIETLSDIN